MTRGGYRPGSGQPPVAGVRKTIRWSIDLTEAQAGEIEAAIPSGVSRQVWVVEAALFVCRRGIVLVPPR